MPQLEQYEKKVFRDPELPMQLSVNRLNAPGQIFLPHWHEHVEIHYFLRGEADIELGQQRFHVKKGDCLISNSNVLHQGTCTRAPYEAFVVIFNINDISRELANQNYIFFPLVHGDDRIGEYIGQIFREIDQKQPGYKQMARAVVAEFVVYLCRNHVAQTLPMRESLKRRKNLERLNTILLYMENNFPQPITVERLAKMVYLSENRFGHLFRESVGKAPLQYLNAIRLRKAMELLKTGEHTVTAVAEAVGFRDYNHFGRLFRKHYGCTPSQVAKETAKE